MRHTTFEAESAGFLRVICGRRFRLLGGWVLSVGCCCLVVAQRHQFPRWLFMWLLLLTILAGCKLLSALNLQHPSALTGGRLLGYCFLWPGLRPQPFLPGPARRALDRQNLWATGSFNLLVGLLLSGLALSG
jgi:hypothetical protein